MKAAVTVSLSAQPIITINKIGEKHITEKGARYYILSRLSKPLPVARLYYIRQGLVAIYVARDDGKPDIRINIIYPDVDYTLRFGTVTDSGYGAGADTNFQKTR
jgi:hypothetical protein